MTYQEGSVFSPEQLEASLAEAIQQWGADSSKTEVLYSQLGTLYAKRVKSAKSTDRQKELTLAQEYLEKAIVLQTKFQKLDLATSLNNLASLYESQGRCSEAEPLYLDALETGKRLFTSDHPNVATILNNLAVLYDNQGRYSEAEPLYLDALEMSERTLGANHPNTITVRNNLRHLQQQITSF
jgi:tetratricopeptide (TPR) repeat protein